MEDTVFLNIISAIDEHKNILISGAGGTGKSYLLRQIASFLKNNGKKVACTATTGVAALNLNDSERKIAASTLHSWAGVGTASLSAARLYGKIMNDPYLRKKWTSTDVLILDEISMLGKSLFEKLDYIGKNIRNNTKCFGGLQLILSGDFFQLPPVKDDWVFESENWKDLKLLTFNLTEPKRYEDREYFNLLLRIREGLHTENDIKILRSRIGCYGKLLKTLEKESVKCIRPTVIYSRKADVQRFNESELKKLKDESVTCVATDTFHKYDSKANFERYENMLDNTIPKSITYKVGAQVMLKCNISISDGLVNGSRGVILEINEDEKEPVIVVSFVVGKIIRITKNTWVIEDEHGNASRSQFPLILAWATTIHKCQGSTLDYAVCDLGHSIFEYGQAYVALSRVRNLKGLFICKLIPKCIKVHPKVLDYFYPTTLVYQIETEKMCCCGQKSLYKTYVASRNKTEYMCQDCIVQNKIVDVEDKYILEFE